MMYEFEVSGMGLDSQSQTPVLVLKQKNSEKSISIVIGLFEATSIVMALQDDVTARPLTHDLFCDFIARSGYCVDKVSIYDLKKGIYYSNICYTKNDDPSCSILTDSRPSDAVALALRFNAPIFIDEKVLLLSNTNINTDEDGFFGREEIFDKSDKGRKWADYLNSLNPEDFGKYKL